MTDERETLEHLETSEILRYVYNVLYTFTQRILTVYLRRLKTEYTMVYVANKRRIYLAE